MPPPKSASTCVQCRARKVRCSGEAPCCSNCDRLEFACSFAESSSVETNSPPHLEKKRRPLACITCRKTKSRCTGERPACDACQTRARECVYPDTKRSRPHQEHGNPRSGTSWLSPKQRALTRRGSHLQASSSQLAQSVLPAVVPAPQLPPSPAQNSSAVPLELDAQSFTTESVHAPRPGSLVALEGSSIVGMTDSWQSSASHASPEGRPGSSAMPTAREQLQIINDFFRHLYPLPGLAFLSEVSVTKRCLDGSIDETLLLAICAYTASILKYSKYHPYHTAGWADRVEELVWRKIESPTVFRTQALLLSVLFRVEMGNFKRGYMLLAMASRSASALRLQYERVDLDHLSSEVRRRLTWSIMLVDSYFSVGLPESGTCPPDFIYLKMPCTEEEFHAETSGLTSQALDGVSEDGLLQHYLRLSIIRRDVMRLKRHLSSQTNSNPQITTLVEEMLRSLKEAELAPYSFENLQKYANSRWFLRYVAVQIAWHQSHCDIYRLFLSGYREAAPEAVIQACSAEYVAQAALASLRHARTVTEIIKGVRSLNRTMVSPPRDICIGGYHATRLLLFLSGSNLIPPEYNITTDDATAFANEMLTILEPLFSSHAMLGRTVKDLARIITTHVPGAPSQPRDSSDEEQATGNKRGARFAMTVQRHTSLGVHSALRYARFLDDDEEVAEGTATNSRERTAPLPMTWLSSSSKVQGGAEPRPDLGHADSSRDWAKSAGAPHGEAMETFPPADFPDPMAQGPWDLDPWMTWGWQNDFSPGSAHDCI